MLDVAAGAVLALFAVGGLRRGFSLSCVSFAIFFVGALVGVLVASFIGGAGLSVVLGGAGGSLAVIAATLRFRELSDAVEYWYPSDAIRYVDKAAGVVLMSVFGMSLVWVYAIVILSSPSAANLRPAVERSALARIATGIAPRGGTVALALMRSGAIPALRGPLITAADPDPATVASASVRQAMASVFRVKGRACNMKTFGTGWVVESHELVTNAHVIAGHESTYVDTGDNTPVLPAVPIWFDPVNDLAVLYVDGLEASMLPMAALPKDGIAAAIIGHPLGQPIKVVPARFDHEVATETKDIYEKPVVAVPIALYRGVVQPGNSGSPIVSADGQVVGTVTATAIGQNVDGGFAIPNHVVLEALGKASARVGTGPCTR